jgi:DNA-binding winged helix-turn-helix (wHTH) protein
MVYSWAASGRLSHSKPERYIRICPGPVNNLLTCHSNLVETLGNEDQAHHAEQPPIGVSFGAYELDFRRQALHKHGVRLKVPPQTLRVLICLVRRAPNLVEREHLFSLLWPSDTHVDFTGNLNAIIRDLRVLLGDSARSPRYIETELRRGYRFIAPVGPLAQPARRGQMESIMPVIPAATPTGESQAQSHRPRLWLNLFALVFFALAAATAFRLWSDKTADAAAAVPRITQLTSFAGRAGHATLSPDGKRVAFHWDGNASGNFNLYIGDLGTEKITRLTNGTVDDLYPAWSPDGRDIAFLRRYASGRCSIYLVSVAASGAERWIQDVPTESSLSWSSDGGWLAYTVLYWTAPKASSPDFGVYAISLLTGQVIRLTKPSSREIGDQDGTFSPDGQRIAFFRSSSTGVSDLYVQNRTRTNFRREARLELRLKSRIPVLRRGPRTVRRSCFRR